MLAEGSSGYVGTHERTCAVHAPGSRGRQVKGLNPAWEEGGWK